MCVFRTTSGRPLSIPSMHKRESEHSWKSTALETVYPNPSTYTAAGSRQQAAHRQRAGSGTARRQAQLGCARGRETQRQRDTQRDTERAGSIRSERD